MGLSVNIYLINLDRREDRLQATLENLDKMGISFIRVSAVDGMLLSKDMPHWTYNLTPGEIGCYLSHKNCLELIAASDAEYGIVLEDDLDFSSKFSKYVINEKWIPKDADIIKLDTCHEVVFIKNIVDLMDGNVRVGRLLSDHLGAAAYIVSRKAAKQLLSFFDDLSIPIDRILFTHDRGILNNMIVYQVTPALCQQSGSPSTINIDRDIWMKSLETPARPKFIQRMFREFARPLRAIVKGVVYSHSKILMRARMRKGQWVKIPFE